MPSVPVSTVAAGPAFVPHIRQLFRGPTLPNQFPASITSGLSSSDVTAQQAAIAELRTFIYRLFFLDLKPFTKVSALVTAGIIGLLIIVGVPVLIHRLYHKRLAVFRIERRTQGLYIVPNAINCFLILEGIFGVVTIAFNVVFWRLFNDHEAEMVKWFQPFRSLSWIPLYLGAFMTGWGSFYSAPGALDKPTASNKKTSAKGHLPWPMIVNCACLGTPVLLMISLIAPVSLSSVKMVDAFKGYKAWDASVQIMLDGTAAGGLIDQAALNEMRTQAYGIFTTWTRSYYYIDIGFVLWAFWAILFMVFYIPAGGVLVYLLYVQLKKQKMILNSYQQKVGVRQAQEPKLPPVSVLTSGQHGGVQAPTNTRLGAPLEDIYEERKGSTNGGSDGTEGHTLSLKGEGGDMFGLESALRQEPPASFAVHGAEEPGLASRAAGMQVMSLMEEGSTAIATSSPPLTPKSQFSFRKLMRKDTHTSNKSRGQARAPAAASAAKQSSKRVSITAGPMSRYKYLRRCLVNLLILYLGIIAASFFFGAVTIYLAAVEYEHALRGPDALAKTITVASMTVVWVSAIFGALTIGSIIFRNFDNPNPEVSQGSGGAEGGGMRKRFTRNTSKVAEEGEGMRSPVMGEKTRTLPAVPESVDMEASMGDVTRSRPRMAGDTEVKFASHRAGGFVISPDDYLASVMSGGDSPEGEAGMSSIGNHGASRLALRPPPVVRSWLGRGEREATMSIPQDVTESFGLTSMPMVRLPTEERDQTLDTDPQGHFRTTDSTLAAYPSFDPRILKQAQHFHSQDEPPQPKTPTSPIIKRQSRLSYSSEPETPASKIAREWAQAQYLATPLPQTPTLGGEQSVDALTLRGDGAWLGELEGQPLSSPPGSPPARPRRDLRREIKGPDERF